MLWKTRMQLIGKKINQTELGFSHQFGIELHRGITLAVKAKGFVACLADYTYCEFSQILHFRNHRLCHLSSLSLLKLNLASPSRLFGRNPFLYNSIHKHIFFILSAGGCICQRISPVCPDIFWIEQASLSIPDS
jgi:hypothetical protein